MHVLPAPLRRLIPVAFVALTAVSLHPLSGATAQAATAPQAAFVPVQPCRLADTRPGSAGGYTRVDPLTISISTRGRCGIPAGATSLAVTLGALQSQNPGFLTAFAADQTRPTVSNLNYLAGQIRANGSIVKTDANGALRIFTSVPADVIVDVVGAFVPSNAASTGRFVPRPSARLFDSRSGQIVAPGGSITIPLPTGIPVDAVALALNVTVTGSTLPGFVTAFPAGTTQPFASMLNLDTTQQTRAAGGIVAVSRLGITVFLSGGGHVIVDFSGYFTGPTAAAGSDGLFTAVEPTRALDTRLASPLGVNVPIYPLSGVEFATARTGAMAYNVTSVDGDPGFIRAFPAGTAQPTTSTINAVGGGDVVANFAITQTSDRGIDVWSQPRTHLLVDVQGWFSGPSLVASIPPPSNIAPPVSSVTYSPCTNGGLDRVNAERMRVGVAQLAVNPAAQAFACLWALHLAQIGGALSHSDSPTRAAAVGCSTGENVAYASGTSTALLMDLWFRSAPHYANIIYPTYVGIGLGYVTRYDPVNGTITYGSTVFSLC